MSIRASNNPFPHDPDDNFKDKLDRGGYEGTAQDLKNQIDALENPDSFLSVGIITKVGNEITIAANQFSWRIDQLIYTNADFATTIAAAAVGYRRIDIIVATKFGTFVKIQGEESIESAQEPSLPPNTLKLTFFNVFGAEIDEPPLPVTDITKLDKDGYTGTAMTLNDAIALESQNRANADDNLSDRIEDAEISISNIIGNKADITYVDSKDSEKENSSNKTSSLSGKEASNSWFPSANGITSWIKNNLFGWLGPHSSPIVSTDTLLIGKSGVLGTKTVADLLSILTVKRKHIMIFSWAGTNLSQANGYWFGQTAYAGKYGMAFTPSVSFTPDNNFSSLNPGFGHSENPPFRSKITKCFVSGFCNGTQSYDYEVAIVNFKLPTPSLYSSVTDGYDHKILARQKFPISPVKIVNKFMDNSSLDLNYVLETNSYFKIFLNAGTGTDRPIQNPFIFIELEEI